MIFKSIIGAACACLAVVSFNVNASTLDLGYDSYTGNVGVWAPYLATYDFSDNDDGTADYIFDWILEYDDVYATYSIPNGMEALWNNDLPYTEGQYDLTFTLATVHVLNEYDPGCGYNTCSGWDDLVNDVHFYVNYNPQSMGMTLQAVPIPAAVWLLGSGLLGLVAVARRRA